MSSATETYHTAAAAFGMMQPGRTWPDPENPAPDDPEYRFGFNGMEKDDAIKGIGNSYTTLFRQYDPRVGRWYSSDNLVKSWESPYSSFGNNPISFTDRLGLNRKQEVGIEGEPQKIYGTERKFGSEVVNRYSGKIWHNGEWINSDEYNSIVDDMVDHMFDEDYNSEDYGIDPNQPLHGNLIRKFYEKGVRKYGKDYNITINGKYHNNPFFEGDQIEPADDIWMIGGLGYSIIRKGAAKAISRFTLYNQGNKSVFLPIGANSAKISTTNKLSTQTISVFHKGELQNGVVSSTRALSTSLEKATAQSLRRSGNVHEFKIPIDKWYEWKSKGFLQEINFKEAGKNIGGSEIKILPPATKELNNYMVK